MAEWHLQFRTLATTFGTEYRQTLGALSAGVGEFDEEHDDAPPCPYFFKNHVWPQHILAKKINGVSITYIKLKHLDPM